MFQTGCDRYPTRLKKTGCLLTKKYTEFISLNNTSGNKGNLVVHRCFRTKSDLMIIAKNAISLLVFLALIGLKITMRKFFASFMSLSVVLNLTRDPFTSKKYLKRVQKKIELCYSIEKCCELTLRKWFWLYWLMPKLISNNTLICYLSFPYIKEYIISFNCCPTTVLPKICSSISLRWGVQQSIVNYWNKHLQFWCNRCRFFPDVCWW